MPRTARAEPDPWLRSLPRSPTGADAVYLSGKQFGARKFAQNFSEEEIAEAVAYAHARGVRVYVTVNTLVHDRELPGVAGYLVRLYTMGVDAMLVQDPGIAALAREIVPGLALHASTQLTIHNAEGVRWAHGQGFSRVVLARELSLAEVESIARATADTGTGLEVFLHGALCYSYSGQCLLSSVIGGRSGTGACAPSRAGRNIPLSLPMQTSTAGQPAGTICRSRTSISSRQKTSAHSGRFPGSQTLRSHH